MTRAPDNLLAVRRLLLTYLNVDKDTVRASDLEPAEVGIVGNSAHRGGYHCGFDRLDADRDYSVVESSRDRTGLTDLASALDVGMFVVTTPKGSFSLRHFSRWLVAQCVAGMPDTSDIREIIYSPDGAVVRRWDRLGRRSSGGSSHLTHTHISFFRDSTRAGRDQTPLFRRYLTTIGLLEDDMALTDAEAARLANIERMVAKMLKGSLAPGPDGRPDNAATWWLRQLADNADPLLAQHMPDWTPIPAGLAQVAAQVAATRADLAALAGRDLVDERQLAAQLAPALLAALTPEAIAAAIPPELARDVADELARRLTS